jgi:uncharacterized protein (TIGR02246 family)
MRYFGPISAGLLLFSASTPPQDPPSAKPTFEAIARQFEKAFNAGDAKALAALLAPDCRVVLETGERIEGREAVEREFAIVFAEDPGRSIKIQVEDVRLIGTNTAIEEGTSTLTPGREGGAPEFSRYLVVHTREGDRWLHAEIRDLPAPTASPHEHLQQLAWMIGDWVSEGAEAQVETHCAWDTSGNFLLREFTAKIAGRPALSGTQRIGWDSAAAQFRTWVFDSEGGFAEGTITRDPDGWLIRAKGVRPDGATGTAVHIVAPIDAHRIRYQTLERSIGGIAADDLESFTLVKQPPSPGASRSAPSTTETRP